MAEYDPGHQTGAWDENGGYEVTDGNRTENIQQHSTDQDQAEYSVDQAQHAEGDSPSPDGATDDAGDYDPASVTAAPAPALSPQMAANQVPLRPSPQRAAKKKPRTAGGFLVGDSDSEDDEPSVPAASSGLAPGAASQPSVPQTSPQHTVTAKQASVLSSNAPAHLANAAAAAPAEGADSSAPVDKVAQLEDRIRQDPRGALEAWLALIAEHRSKNDVEGARQAYERFFTVFPQAVSYLSFVP